jgi:hypothetical protein
VGEVKNLLDQMQEEDGKRKQKTTVKNELFGDESDDDLSEDECDDEDESNVQIVHDSHIDDSTKHGCRLSQTRLAMFLIKRDEEGGSRKHRCVLEESFRTELTRLGRENEGTDAIMKDHMRECLARASRTCQPIKLEGNKSLTAEIFVSFLLSLSDTKAGKFKKACGGHRSALSDLLGQCEAVSSAAFVKKMKRLHQGLNRRSAKARGENGGKLGEGKDPLPFELHRAICTWLLADGSKESVFAHCFLTLTWNLMCRSKNTVYINRRHLSWSGDAMAVNFAHTKSNMEGSDAGHKRHICANPKMPEICSVLSAGRHLAAFPAEASGRLFGGQRQFDRFHWSALNPKRGSNLLLLRNCEGTIPCGSLQPSRCVQVLVSRVSDPFCSANTNLCLFLLF